MKVPYVKTTDIEKYMNKFGIGSCAPVSYVLREMGYGEIETGLFGKKGDYITSFPHYWIRTKKGKMLDLTLPSDARGVYWEIEKIRNNEEPDPNLYGKDDYAWWRNKIYFK